MTRKKSTTVTDLDAAGVRGEVLDFSVGLDGMICVLTAKRVPEYRRTSDGGCFFHTFSRRTNHYSVYLISSGHTHRVNISTRENFTDARALGVDRLLLMRGRMRAGEPDNGLILDLNGRLIRRIRIGDCAQHIFVTPDQSIWVGYGDEAFMSERAHGGGIVLLDGRGRVKFSLHESGKADCVDCYAMTMDRRGTIHACVYPDFPILRMTLAGQVRQLAKPGQAGSGVLAVRGNAAITSGGYDKPFEVFRRALTTGRRTRVRVPGAGRYPLDGAHTFGLDGTLYVLRGRKLFAIDACS